MARALNGLGTFRWFASRRSGQ